MIRQIALASLIVFGGLIAWGGAQATYDVTFFFTTSDFITADTGVVSEGLPTFTCSDRLNLAEYCTEVMFQPSVTTAGGPMVGVRAGFIIGDNPGFIATGFFPLGSLGTDGTFMTDIGSATDPNEIFQTSFTSSNSLSVVSSTSAVPEPASWTLMILGFAGLGVAARRRLWRAEGSNCRSMVFHRRWVLSQ
jgi:PEP-CTERM motif